MGILARLRLAKIRTMARPNSPDMPLKRTKQVRLGINTGQSDHERMNEQTERTNERPKKRTNERTKK